MAEQVKLVRTYDNLADVSSVSLIGDTDGFDIAYEGWIPQGIPDKKGDIVDTFTLRARAASTDAVAANIQKIAALQTVARNYWSGPYETSAVWLRAQLAGETNARQTLVTELNHEPGASVYEYAFRNIHHLNSYIVAVKHPDWWEGTALTTYQAASVNFLGGTFAYGAVAGDMPGRLAQVQVTGLSASTSAIWPNGQMWLGFRSNRYGTPTHWRGSYDIGTAALVSVQGMGMIGDAQAMGTSAAMITGAYQFSVGNPVYDRGTGVMTPWLGVTMGTITSGTPAAMTGQFLVLLRAKVKSNSGTANVSYNVQMSTGFANDRAVGKGGKLYGERYYPRVPVYSVGGRMDNDYHLYEMGMVQFPPDRTNPGVDYSDFQIRVGAEVVSVTPTWGSGISGWYAGGTLIADALVFIPADDGYYQVGRDAGDATISALTGNDVTLALQGNNWPNDISAAIVSGTARTYGVNTPYYSGGVPAGTGIAVLAAHSWGTIPSYSTWAGTVNLQIASRWQSLRGTA